MSAHIYKRSRGERCPRGEMRAVVDIIHALCPDMSGRQMARRLGVNASTVQRHLENARYDAQAV